MTPNILKAITAISSTTEGPFYAMDLESVRVTAAEFLKAWRRYFPNFNAAYSFKSNRLKAVTAIMLSEGYGAEIVSGLELDLALGDGFPANSIVFDGPVKMPSEIDKALANNVLIQIDSLAELSNILRRSRERMPRLTLRLAVQYNAEKLSRFGLTSDEFQGALKMLKEANVSPLGVHFHVGTNINMPEIHAHAIETYAKEIRELIPGNAQPLIIDVGGGFPANTLRGTEAPVPPHRFAKAVAERLEKIGIRPDQVQLIAEPGRSLVEDACSLVMPVHAFKERDGRKIVVVEGGLNLARSLFGWHHQLKFVIARPAGKQAPYDIYGFNCFESDVLGENIEIDSGIAMGDLVIVTSVGAYDISNCASWIRHLPPIFDVSPGQSPRLIRAAASDPRAGE